MGCGSSDYRCAFVVICISTVFTLFEKLLALYDFMCLVTALAKNNNNNNSETRMNNKKATKRLQQQEQLPSLTDDSSFNEQSLSVSFSEENHTGVCRYQVTLAPQLWLCCIVDPSLLPSLFLPTTSAKDEKVKHQLQDSCAITCASRLASHAAPFSSPAAGGCRALTTWGGWPLRRLFFF